MDKLVAVIRALFGCYPNTTFSEDNLKAYVMVLQQVPVSELEVVMVQVMSNPGKFIPTPGDILEMWRRSKGILPAVDAAESAWGEVLRNFRYPGAWGTPSFLDPLAERVVKSMGWQTLCGSENQMADRAHFLRMYDAFAKGSADQARMTPAYKNLLEANRQPQLEARDEREEEAR